MNENQIKTILIQFYHGISTLRQASMGFSLTRNAHRRVRVRV